MKATSDLYEMQTVESADRTAEYRQRCGFSKYKSLFLAVLIKLPAERAVPERERRPGKGTGRGGGDLRKWGAEKRQEGERVQATGAATKQNERRGKTARHSTPENIMKLDDDNVRGVY